MIIRARAPLRLGLGGGGTDVSPYCDVYSGAVLNVTIDMYAYTTIEPRADGRVAFIARDIDERFEAEADGDMLVATPLILHRAVYRRMVDDFNEGRPLPCQVTTFCDAPPGSGLGTSSTMVVSLIKAFTEWLDLPLGEYEIAYLAYEIERIDAGLGGGRQDQYAATFGGVNFIEFHPGERVIVNPLRVKNWIMSEFETSLVLFNSGVSRSSAEIIAEQTGNLVSQPDGRTLDAMHEIKADAIGMKECLLKGDFIHFAGFMRKSWQAKKRLADAVSNNRIDHVVETALEAGARAGKVSGAGGGGFITFLVNPARRVDVIRALSREEGQVMTCHTTQRTGRKGGSCSEAGGPDARSLRTLADEWACGLSRGASSPATVDSGEAERKTHSDSGKAAPLRLIVLSGCKHGKCEDCCEGREDCCEPLDTVLVPSRAIYPGDSCRACYRSNLICFLIAASQQSRGTAGGAG